MRSAFHPADPELLDQESSLCEARIEPDIEYPVNHVEEKIIKLHISPEWSVVGAEEWNKLLFGPFALHDFTPSSMWNTRGRSSWTRVNISVRESTKTAPRPDIFISSIMLKRALVTE